MTAFKNFSQYSKIFHRVSACKIWHGGGGYFSTLGKIVNFCPNLSGKSTEASLVVAEHWKAKCAVIQSVSQNKTCQENPILLEQI